MVGKPISRILLLCIPFLFQINDGINFLDYVIISKDLDSRTSVSMQHNHQSTGRGYLGRAPFPPRSSGRSPVCQTDVAMQPVPGQCEVQPEWEDLIHAPPAYQMHHFFGETSGLFGPMETYQNPSFVNEDSDTQMGFSHVSDTKVPDYKTVHVSGNKSSDTMLGSSITSRPSLASYYKVFDVDKSSSLLPQTKLSGNDTIESNPSHITPDSAISSIVDVKKNKKKGKWKKLDIATPTSRVSHSTWTTR